MKNWIILLLTFIPVAASSQFYKKHLLKKDRLVISFSEGILNIIPLSDKAIRIQFEKDLSKEKQEVVFINKHPVPKFKFDETPQQLILTTSAIRVVFNKRNGAIEYRDIYGRVFLSEKGGSRVLKADKINGENCFIAGQSFDSPDDEYLFGLGQFQDGYYNLRNVPRKLIQVNTQIAIPFLYSSRGYGILWHQYGLTYFNPANDTIPLFKKDNSAAEKRDVEISTTSGTQKVSQQESVYTGKIDVDKEQEYAFMLDFGNMESRHLLLIDGKPYIDQSNLWLPPAVGKLIHLKTGQHTIQVVCKSRNAPKLTWKVTGKETTFRSPNAKSLDYVVFYSNNTDDVIASYRDLSGNVPMLPLWAYGFWQCRERYTSGNHLVETVKEFRRRNLPMDVIVQDWQYWGRHGWGVPKFDEANYPNPDQFIKQLHDLNARFSISVWENLDKKSEVSEPYRSKKLYIPNSPWLDIFNPETQKTHWGVLDKNLFKLGVDSWWMDATEPENDALAGTQTYLGPGEFYRLIYPLFVSKAVYEGQRRSNSQKRVVILTRSAFAGQQRYGTINWSGDIGWSWDAYRRQIVSGLNYSLTGMPYWTTDIGGFFRPGQSQYQDPKYHEILIRWFQWGAFNPIFRIHGYQSETEPWKYGDTVEKSMRDMLNLRYRLMPYIYSEAWKISKEGSTIMRPLVMDFKNDPTAVAQPYQYMFGQSFLVAPVTEPGVTELKVYLPESGGWFDYWTGKYYSGGKSIKAATPLNKIPLYIKSGSIIPIGQIMQYTNEKPMDTLEIRVYKGKNAEFSLYEDEGDNYGYEKGKYTLIPFKWSEKQQSLTIGALKGSYPGYLRKRTFKIVFVNKNIKSEDSAGSSERIVLYTGRKVFVKGN